MAQYEQLSAGADIVFPITAIQAIHSDNQSIGGGSPNEELVSLLGRLFTRINNLENQVTNLTNTVSNLESRLRTLQGQTSTEHFTIQLYTYTKDEDTYPTQNDTVGANFEKLFTDKGILLGEEVLSNNGWFFESKKAASEGISSGFEEPAIWCIKIEVSKTRDWYKAYPSLSYFKYDPSLSEGEALIAKFKTLLNSVDQRCDNKISQLNTAITNLNNQFDEAVQNVKDAVEDDVSTAVNTKVGAEFTAWGLDRDKWISINNLTTQFTGNAFNTKLQQALSQNGWGSTDRINLSTKLTSLEGKVTTCDEFVTDPSSYISSRLDAKTILNKLSDDTTNISFDGVNRTAKSRLNEILFGTDNGTVITADTYMEKTGLTKFKVAIAGTEGANKSIEEVLQSKVGLEENGVLSRVVAAYASTGIAGSGFNETSFTAWADSDTGKRILRKSVGCATKTVDGVETYMTVDDMIPGMDQVGYIAQQAASGQCMSGKSYNAPIGQCSSSTIFIKS